ncbi:MAG TPA: hypothetical protein VLH59_15120 [Ignavibacteriaceae bacterium]|nr:hypothetical protein [Ignavibacteriaceae bacterium]
MGEEESLNTIERRYHRLIKISADHKNHNNQRSIISHKGINMNKSISRTISEPVCRQAGLPQINKKVNK